MVASQHTPAGPVEQLEVEIMRYIARLHREKAGDYSVAVVELPGCFSAADTLQEAISNAEEAILGHLDVMVEDGMPIPLPCSEPPQDLERNELLVAVEVDLSKIALSGKPVRLNVSIPERAVALIDRAAKRAGMSRSGFLTTAALTYAERDR